MTDDNDAKARETAHGLIQSYIGQDHKVIDMKAFDLHKRHVQRIDGG
jgi:predicted ATP-dependent protease